MSGAARSIIGVAQRATVEVATGALQARAAKLLFVGGLDTVEIAALFHCTEAEAVTLLWHAPLARREPG